MTGPGLVIEWCSGIGGMRLGLELAGIPHEVVAHSEIDPYACAVYEKHWPSTPNLGDMRDLDSWDSVSAILQRVEGATVSAGPVAAPVPSALIVENVPAWLSLGLPRCLHDLATIGFDAEWTTLCACRVGAPHHRPRVFLVAYPNGESESLGSIHEEVARVREVSGPLSWPDRPGDMGGVDGVPSRMDRLRCLGNAVVPQVFAEVARRVWR